MTIKGLPATGKPYEVREEKVKINLPLIITAIALVSVGWLSLREFVLQRFGKKADMNVIMKAVVAWILAGVLLLMMTEKILGG